MPPPPLCKLGIRRDHTKAMMFRAFLLGLVWKIWPKLSEDLFFLILHLILGENLDQIWVKTFFLFCTWFWAKIWTKFEWRLFFLLFTRFRAKIRTTFGRNNVCFRSLFLPNFLKFLAFPLSKILRALLFQSLHWLAFYYRFFVLSHQVSYLHLYLFCWTYSNNCLTFRCFFVIIFLCFCFRFNCLKYLDFGLAYLWP